jgi:hypothetical protein
MKIYICNTPEQKQEERVNRREVVRVTEHNKAELCCYAAIKPYNFILEYLLTHPSPPLVPNLLAATTILLPSIPVRVVAFHILILLHTSVIGTAIPRAGSVGPSLAFLRGRITGFTLPSMRTRRLLGLRRRVPLVSRHDFSCLLFFWSGVWLFVVLE